MNQCIMINTLKLKWRFTMVKYIQFFNIPEDNEYCACLSVILLDSIFVNSNKEYYPQIFLECKYIIKDRKIYKINEDLKLNKSDDESDE